MNDQTTHDTLTHEPESALEESLEINWNEIFAASEPGHPGGRIAYDSGDYATEEEADAALHTFFTRIIEGPYEEDQAETDIHGRCEARHETGSRLPATQVQSAARASHSGLSRKQHAR